MRVIVRCLVLKQPDSMSLIVEAFRSIFARDGLVLLKAVTTWQRGALHAPDVGTRQAVVVCRVCALCCLCTAVIWLFENLHNSVVLAQRVRWPPSQSQLLHSPMLYSLYHQTLSNTNNPVSISGAIM